jgi:rhodanese-related sulfurtransferase
MTARSLPQRPPSQIIPDAYCTIRAETKRALMPESIGLPQLRQLIVDGAQLIDVLPADEYAEEHLPGATNIPLKRLDAHTTSKLDRHKPVAVYCHDAL